MSVGVAVAVGVVVSVALGAVVGLAAACVVGVTVCAAALRVASISTVLRHRLRHG